MAKAIEVEVSANLNLRNIADFHHEQAIHLRALADEHETHCQRITEMIEEKTEQ